MYEKIRTKHLKCKYRMCDMLYIHLQHYFAVVSFALTTKLNNNSNLQTKTSLSVFICIFSERGLEKKCTKTEN